MLASDIRAHRRHIGTSRAAAGAIGGPIIHEPSPLVEQVAAPIGPLHLVLDSVRQGHFRDLMGIASAFGGPVAEAGTEAVDGHVNLHSAEQHGHGHAGHFPALGRRE